MAKSNSIRNDHPSIVRGLIAGLAAGIVAAAAMNRFQTMVSAFSGGGGGGDSSTVKAADKLKQAVTGEKLRNSEKAPAEVILHYGLGAALGIAYGLAAEFRPAVTRGSGTMFGSAVALLLDEGAVPALGLAEPPTKTSASGHLFGFSSHAMFGATAEATRAMVVAALKG